jgi:hypothetical protein
MPITRNTGFLIGAIDGSNALTPVSVAAGATLHSGVLDLTGNDAGTGAAHVWLYVKRNAGFTGDAPVKFRLNGIPNPAVAAQPAGEDYKVKMAEWVFEADVPGLDDGYKIIDLGVTDRVPRRVAAEVFNGHGTDAILVAVRYEAEVIS